MKTSIALMCMTKNSRGRIHELLGSVVGLCDKAYILDTGSTDGTVEYLRTVPMVPYPLALIESPFVDFSVSRNHLMQWGRAEALRQADQTWFVLLDDDMVLKENNEGAYAKLKETLSAKSLFDALMLKHTGTPEYWVTRIVRAELDWYYKGVTHEYLAPTRLTGRAGSVNILHFHNHGPAKFDRDLKMLSADIARDPNDPRTVFYIAQTLRDQGANAAAARYYFMRAQMGGWPEEVYVSMWESARLSNNPKLMEAAHNFRPSRAEASFWLAAYYRAAGDKNLADLWEATRAKIPFSRDVLFVVPHCYDEYNPEPTL